MNWAQLFPKFALEESGHSKNESYQDDASPRVPQMNKEVEVADIGCGFGGLLVALAPKLPNTLMLGILYT